MRLLLHAVTSGEVLPGDTPGGLRGQTLVGMLQGEVTGWATWLADADPKFGRSDLLEQHAIISRLYGQVDACLPARFPTWYADEAALRAELCRKQADLRAGLAAVRGNCELAVTVLWNGPAEPGLPSEAVTPGIRYLQQRQQAFGGSDRRRARARELAAEIERLAGPDLVAATAQVCPSATVAVSSALLAPRDSATALIARLPRARDGVRILVNGPWPPYSFAGTGRREA
jgi:hypothetical protein